MDINIALAALAALSQETRLRAFRLLVQAGPEGLPAGEISEALGIPHNSLSFHLGHLERAGLATARREGRSIIYSANFPFMQEIVGYLAENCCSAEFVRVRKEARSKKSLIELTPCCGPKGKRS
ncbi:MAG: helix-turn-helix transcriptional regulator [Gammaproteobacteria bacterium]|nr:helix-turn-helix transcriptional regulator [Gammaproteobacteria bacterium]